MSAELFLDNLPLIEEVIRFACRRHQLSGADAEDFAAAVKLKLVEGDYAVLHKFSGASGGGGASMRAYLAVVVHRLLLDERIARWGKWRPSAEAKRRGAIALRLEELLYRDGLSVEAAYRRLLDEEKLETTRAALDELRQCLPQRSKRRLVSDVDLREHTAPEATRPDTALERQEAQAVQRKAIGLVHEALAGLDWEDRAILRLRFEQGLTVQQLAPLLSLEPKPVYRRLERILLLLRRGLETSLRERGLDPREIVPALGSVWFEGDEDNHLPDAATAGTGGGRPSIDRENR